MVEKKNEKSKPTKKREQHRLNGNEGKEQLQTLKAFN